MRVKMFFLIRTFKKFKRLDLDLYGQKTRLLVARLQSTAIKNFLKNHRTNQTKMFDQEGLREKS